MGEEGRVDFRDRIRQGYLVGDGAMATLLYQFGVPVRACFEEICLTEPAMVREVHRAYINAGAEWIQTNTFSGHRVGLTRYGLEHQVAEINRAAARVAREAAGDGVYVFGTVGSTSDLGAPGLTLQENRASLCAVFEEQVTALMDESVDGLLLETFADLDEMMAAIETARRLTNRPIIANLSPDAIGVTRDGYSVGEAFTAMVGAGADVVGLNCRLGLSGILRTYEKLSLQQDIAYAAVPNAGMLHMVDGDYSYTANEDYFADVGRQLAEQGVTVLGGCCGTTPEHIRKLAAALEGAGAASRRRGDRVSADSVADGLHERKARITVREPERERASAAPTVAEANGSDDQFSLLETVKDRTTVVVELDPPRTLNVGKYIAGAVALRDAGADTVTLADNSLGTVRVSNMALASVLKQLDIEPLVHVACRDRNLVGQQSHLMGLHVLGIHHILLVTGDPSRFGDLPGATSVFDVSSIELTTMVKRLNAGIGFSGQGLKTPARFVVGTSFNPNVTHFHKAVDRLKRKLDAGADYVMTQPIFDPRMFEVIARAVDPYHAPVFIGVMPITSARNAQFLHNEVPGIRLTDEILERMRRAPAETAAEEGVAIAQALLDEATQHFRGIYLVTPFLRYDLTVRLTRYVREMDMASGVQKAVN